jgi:hypothetical protein
MKKKSQCSECRLSLATGKVIMTSSMYTKDLLIPREAKKPSWLVSIAASLILAREAKYTCLRNQGGLSHCRFLCSLPQHSQRGRNHCRFSCPLPKEAAVTDVTCVPCHSLRSRRGQNRACTCSSRSGSTHPQSRRSSTSFLTKCKAKCIKLINIKGYICPLPFFIFFTCFLPPYSVS